MTEKDLEEIQGECRKREIDRLRDLLIKNASYRSRPIIVSQNKIDIDTENGKENENNPRRTQRKNYEIVR
jgi:hypothetical protein